MSILSNESTRFFDIIYWNFEPELDFPWKKGSDKLPSQFSRKSWFHKNHKTEGQPWNKIFKIRILLITRLLQGPMYAKLRLPPQNRSFSRCILRQTATLTGPNDRIEPNYFLYRDVNFLAEKKSCFFGSPECVWLLWASPEWKNEENIDFYEKNPEIKNRNFSGNRNFRDSVISSETPW